MNILIVKSSSFIQADIEEAFSILGHTTYSITAPPVNSNEQNTYLQALIVNISEYSPVFIFSIGIYPFISYACELIGLRYIAWLTDSYHPNFFSPAIRNSKTWLFASDSALTTELQKLGAAHIAFLPLAAGLPRIQRVLEQENNCSHFACDISFFGNIINREDMHPHPLSPDNELRDSTKGYLEGCIACQHQARLFPPMSENLPPYVWEDLYNNFPIEINNSLEHPTHYYDFNYFNPDITYIDRKRHLNELASQTRFQTIYLYSGSEFISEKIKQRPIDKYKDKLPLIAKNSTINLVIAHRNYISAIPASAWEIMASKGFLISNHQSDYNRIFSTKPTLYKTDKELFSKAAYYFHHEAERKELTNELYENVSKHHTYEERLKEMLSIL